MLKSLSILISESKYALVSILISEFDIGVKICFSHSSSILIFESDFGIQTCLCLEESLLDISSS